MPESSSQKLEKDFFQPAPTVESPSKEAEWREPLKICNSCKRQKPLSQMVLGTNECRDCRMKRLFLKRMESHTPWR